VRGWRFLPASRDGAATTEWTAVSFKFGPEGVTQVEAPADTEIARADRNKIICRPANSVPNSHIPDAPACLPKWEWQQRDHAQTVKKWQMPTAPAMGGQSGSGG